MLSRKTLRSVHLFGTVWFMLCVGYVLVLSLRQVGVRWWVLFSLSGHGVLIVFMLISLYLFAVFRGASGSHVHRVEHPLTSTDYYTLFYVMTPFLGGLTGCFAVIGISTVVQRFLLSIAMGTLGATFTVWVIVDPLAGILEALLSPTARRHRSQRLAEIKARREREQEERERLLTNILEEEESRREQWAALLGPHAERLARRLTADNPDSEDAERVAVDVGANAWQIGGLGCMRQLQEMTIGLCRERGGDNSISAHISVWWDGIGNWRNPSIEQQLRN